MGEKVSLRLGGALIIIRHFRPRYAVQVGETHSQSANRV
ncbi:unnamed protein product [Nippostrongylus brasiliensis]|uniref:Uncharacterized protein n=1 Tax=Nippostrongylus brasiliensis TaxID=27835 RepID=A0A0N4YU77_NIPBR|nr:unnamed protein product [Nippostrongylus brasiliensis]